MSNDETFFVLNGTYFVSKNKAGHFIYKANESAFKKNSSVLKKKYHDLPRYKVILDHEKEFKDACDSFLFSLTKNIVSFLKKEIK